MKPTSILPTPSTVSEFSFRPSCMPSRKCNFLVIVAVAAIALLPACGPAGPPAGVTHTWDVEYELGKAKDRSSTTPAMVCSAHRLIEASRDLQKHGPGCLGGSAEERAQLDRYVAAVSPLLSPDFAADLEAFRAAVHRKSLGSDPDYIRVLYDPLLQRLWQPETQVISMDVECDRDAGEQGIAIYSLLLSGKIYSGDLCQTDLIFRQFPDGWKITEIRQGYIDFPIEDSKWEKVDVRKELRKFAKSVPK